jgi:two-component system sensor histidine kinase KdpD
MVLIRWLSVLAVVTAVMFVVRERLDKAHVALGFLMVVLGGSAAGGRVAGVGLALLAFLSFNFLFLRPYYTLSIDEPLDWLVLAAFLMTGVIAAQLLDRAQERAVVAQQRTLEVERLAALGAETLNAGRAEDALQGIATVIRSTIGVACCQVLTPLDGAMSLSLLAQSGVCDRGKTGAGRTGEPWGLDAWVAQKHAVAAERPDGTKWIGMVGQPDGRLQWPPDGTEMRTLFIPLMVRDRMVGVLCITHDEAFTLDPRTQQFLSALSYYAALGVERVLLVADAERAEAFRQADSLKSAVIAGLSHDLRTPLTSIKALAHTLRERGHVEAGAIEQEADRLNRLVADLLDLSRLNAGSMPMRPEVNAAEDLLGAAIQRVGGMMDYRRIVVIPSASARNGGADMLLLGRFDFVQALRALVNLIENAHKYSPSGEAIDIHVRRAGDELQFLVMDRGVGVPVQERERIFEPFYRAPDAAPDVGGAGLGLAIAKGLAGQQGGDVRYEAREGGGSVFTLALPAVDAPPAATDEQRRAAE